MYTINDIVSILQPIFTHIFTEKDIISEYLFDSRKVIFPKESLFFAIKTEQNDGHLYIDELIHKGVRNFVVSQKIVSTPLHKKCNFIQVEDPILALQKIAIHHRQQFSIPIIGITGSNGKTIVKEWLSSMLNEEFTIVKNPHSYNSQIGVPISILQLNNAHELGIFEAGISHPKEMECLEPIISPTLGIITNIGAAHSQYFNYEEEKLKEKLKLFSHCNQLIYCIDHPLIHKTLAKDDYAHLKKVSWGKSIETNYHISSLIKKRTHTEVVINDHSIEIPFTDEASIENTLHCVVCLHLLGYSFGSINQKLMELLPLQMRMEIKEANNHSIIINDTYSLDFNSLKVALDFLSSQKQFSKKSLIISDFLQSKPLQEKEYQEMAQLFQSHHLSQLIVVGRNFKKFQSIFASKNFTFNTFFFNDTEELLGEIDSFEFLNEAILIKGARQFYFEKIVNTLQRKSHKTILLVNLPAIIHNLNYYRSKLHPSVKVIAMVKALSYGLGDVELINELQYHNVNYLAVAYVDEGVRLRKKNIHTPIIILGAEEHSFNSLIRYNLEPEIFNFHYLTELEKIVRYYPELTDFKIHIKLDTGMRRLGFDSEDLDELIARLHNHPQLRIASIFSHLASAEDMEENAFTLQQIHNFTEMSEKIMKAFDYPIFRHLLNSAGISRFPEAQFDMVRLGLGLYGFSGVKEDRPNLQHPVTLKSVITQIKRIKKGDSVGYNRTFIASKEMTIGIVPIGYADGFFTELSNGIGTIIVHDKHVPIIGKICMDMCMIDLSEVGNAHIGDEAIIYGEDNRINEIAQRIQKTPYELLTAISKRVPRVYIME